MSYSRAVHPSFHFLLVALLALGFAACGGSNQPASTPPPTGGATVVPGGTSGTAPGGGSSSPTFVSYVYTAGDTSINGYGVSANGSLTPVSGSPMATSTFGGQIVTNGANVYVVAGDATTLKIYSLNRSTGALTLGNSLNAIAGNPNTQDLTSTLALDHSGTNLYIGEMDGSGDDGQNVYTVGSTATATQIQWEGGSGSEQFGPPLAFSPDNNFAYTANCYHLGWSIFQFQRASSGTLSFSNINGGNAGGPAVLDQNFPCPEAFAVSAQGYLAVAYNDQSGNGTPETLMLTSYHINTDGTLTAVAGSKVVTASSLNPSNSANPQVGLAFDPTGTFLAVAGSGGVQTYSMSATGTLTVAGAPQNAGVQFQNVSWDKSNHVFATGNGQLYVYSSTNGVLTAASGSPYSGGVGVTVLPLN